MACISRADSRELKAKLKEAIDSGKTSMDELVEIARPYYNIDPEEAVERELRKKVNSIIKQDRDKDGVPNNVVTKDNGGKVVNLQTCSSQSDVDAVIEQLMKLLNSIVKTLRKAKLRRAEIDGQIGLFEDEEAE